MSRFPELAILFLPLVLLAGQAMAQDAGAGEKVFRKCKACHAVGEGARHRVGPHLNAVIGREAGSLDDYRYSKAMRKAGAEGLVWDEPALDNYLAAPRKMIKGTKMAFAGLREADDRENVIAYLKTFQAETDDASEGAKAPAAPAGKTPTAAEPTPTGSGSAILPGHGVYHLGRAALPAEIAAWDIDIRPDGRGLPKGSGTVAEGEAVYSERCASCHGVFGEGEGRWPVLAGGHGSLRDMRPVKTIGSYWPYLSTVYDYVRRAMPFGDARSLSDDEVYALTAYLLYLNDVVTDENFELSDRNFADIDLPNQPNFIADDRLLEPHYADPAEPCMKDCKPGDAAVEMRARVLDVTPDSDEEGDGAIE